MMIAVLLLLILPVMLLLGLATGHILCRIPGKRDTGKTVNVICSELLILPVLLWGVILLIFSSSSETVLTRPQINFLVTALPVALLVCSVHIKKLRKKAVLFPACAVFLIGIALWGQTAYVNAVPTVDEYGGGYSPFHESVSTLDAPSTLTLEGDLPELDGATALYPVYAAFYRACYPETTHYPDLIACTTTSYAYKRIVTGKADVIFAAEPSREQLAFSRENNVELVFTPIGSEAFVFLVNAKNPVENLTIDELRRIYRGEIIDWSAFGGTGNIIAYQRSDGSGSQTAFENYVLSADELSPAPEELVEGDMGGLYSRVADYRNFKNAIGYSFRVYCADLMGGKGVKLLSVNGVAPTDENIKNGLYPFAGHFYAVTRADADENVKAFLNWMQGPQGQELVEKAGYVPLDG